MTELGIALLAFLVIAAAGLAALHYGPRGGGISDESKDTVRFVQGTVASISAMLLSLLLASSANSYRAQAEQLRRLATELVGMDRVLAEIGPPAEPARAALRRNAQHALRTVWAEGRPPVTSPPDATVFEELVGLSPSSPRESFLVARALEQTLAVARLRTGLLTAENETVLQAPLLVMLVFWFVLLFLAIGLFATPNRVTVAATVFGAAAVASALYLILELDQPFNGLIAIPDAPLRQALAAIGGS